MTLWTLFVRTLVWLSALVALPLSYLLFWPVQRPSVPSGAEAEPLIESPAETWKPRYDVGLSGPYVPNGALTHARWLSVRRESTYDVGLPVPKTAKRGTAPETVAVGPNDGKLYTGLCDVDAAAVGVDPPPCRDVGPFQGWVVRIDPKTLEVEDYVATGGRPLGMAFDQHGNLYVADGYKGLLRVQHAKHEDGQAATKFHTVVPVANCNTPEEQRAADHYQSTKRDNSHRRLQGEPVHDEISHAARTALGREEADWQQQNETGDRYWLPESAEASGQPLYTDSVAIDIRDGAVYFTCPSQRWDLAHIHQDALESVATGRLFRYMPDESCSAEPKTCKKDLLLDNLGFANGVAVHPTEKYLLLNEWYRFRVLKLWLDGRDNPREVFFDNTPGYPDNVTIGPDGTVWIGLVILRNAVADRFHGHRAWLDMLNHVSIPLDPYAFLLGLSPDGKVATQTLQDSSGFYDQATGAHIVGDAMYVTSNTREALLCLRRPGAPVLSCSHPDLSPREAILDPCDPWSAGPYEKCLKKNASARVTP